jgi:methyltransferase (TIGR00027 family)
MGDDAVQRTSDWIAVMRDDEHRRADAYLRDPHAHLLTGEPAISQVAYQRGIGSPVGVVVGRGRFGDAVIAQAVRAGVRQVVGLGAGSDTRAWRLDLPPELAWFELDLPGQLDAKNAVFDALDIRASCVRSCVEADLRGDWYPALADAGFDAARPTVWIAEGLFYYLDRPDALRLAADVTRFSARGSELVFDIPHTEFAHDPGKARFLSFMRDRGSPWVGRSTTRASCCLAERGRPRRTCHPTSPRADAPGWSRCPCGSRATTGSSGTRGRAVRGWLREGVIFDPTV